MAKKWEYQNLKGTLFPNDKEGNEKRPDYTGLAKIENTMYRMSAWITKSKKGGTFLSINFQLEQKKEQSDEAPF